MCARWPTIAMSNFFFGFERSFCRCMAVMSCDLGWCVCDLTSFHQVMWLVVRWFVLLRSYSVLQRPTTYYSSTTPTCYSVLLQDYSVLQSTTPVLLQYYKVLLCTIKYYASTTKYYASTTTYYSSTTLYYKVLLQYYSVLQSTTAVWLELLHVMWCDVWACQLLLHPRIPRSSNINKEIYIYISTYVLTRHNSVNQSLVPW